MTPEEIRSSLASAIDAAWLGRCPIAWQNYDFNASNATAWIRPVILMADTFVGELGEDGIGMRTGVLKTSIFTPPNIGSKKGNDYAAILETLFRRACINGVQFDEPNTREIGVEEGWYHTMVTVDIWTWVGE